MEPHPIPQNVTSFEFRLVGDMTLKQFFYLGAGVGTAYILYATAFYSYPVVALPLIIISALSGVAFAFLPIFDRPLDHWVKAFFEAVYSPTKGTWKTNLTGNQKITPDDPVFKNRLQTYFSSIGINKNPEPEIKKEPVAQIKTTVFNPPTKLPSSQDLEGLVEMAKQAQVLQTKIADTEKLIKQMTSEGKTAEVPQVSANLQNLISQTEELYKKTVEMNKVAPQSASINQPKATAAPRVVVIPDIPSKPTSIVLTSTPNVINGIVSDPAGNYLENVIVIIHNKEGIPVRALKTNKLGQFVGSTPLAPGVYTVTLEKEGFVFQTLEITLDNAALQPLRITAGKGGA